VKTRLKETWCYLLYPVAGERAGRCRVDRGKVPAQDGLLSRASKKLVSDEGLLPELGPARLDRELQKYIWNGKDHLSLKDLWEYLNRYIYLPRVKNRNVLIKAVQAAVGGWCLALSPMRNDGTRRLHRTRPSECCECPGGHRLRQRHREARGGGKAGPREPQRPLPRHQNRCRHRRKLRQNRPA
jgi:hypothetical protein